MTHRRQFLRTALAAGASLPAMALSGCEDIIKVLAGACPADPAESGGIDWIPDVLHPVFYGYRDLGTADGAPGTLRIWYPTYEGFTDGAPILKLCVGRWPVVLFLHGQPPCPDPNYYQRWTTLPSVLARSGYVVVVPSHQASLTTEVGSPAVANALRFLDWVRSGWEHSKWVDARPEATAVAGHSFGAVLGAFVKQARPQISAFVGLSGVWTELGNPAPVLQGVGPGSFFMWGNERDRLDVGALWDNQVAAPKHYAFVDGGEHFDYLSRTWTAGCAFPRSRCTLVETVAAELTALFLARTVPVELSHAPIPVSLDPPAVTLTPKQQFFSGGQLSGLAQIKTRACCSIDLHWLDGSQPGSRHLGTTACPIA
jgi:alpha/beta superfamily hydrolase